MIVIRAFLSPLIPRIILMRLGLNRLIEQARREPFPYGPRRRPAQVTDERDDGGLFGIRYRPISRRNASVVTIGIP
ncbi:hypothetical protein Pth03_10910 [Planotetraspora thailandica]|uniref:Uncharacterized protein n=1 Tax=Planotetraspora thailandica TaxID=487172 RepID=A0A8J3XS22_9ACTN|nr:hypothetical protein Pth03_10910 [Planotetraspora thailandica]